MSQTTHNEDNTANQKEYHRPKLQKFGNVSELTLSNAFSGTASADGGTFPNGYVGGGS